MKQTRGRKKQRIPVFTLKYSNPDGNVEVYEMSTKGFILATQANDFKNQENYCAQNNENNELDNQNILNEIEIDQFSNDQAYMYNNPSSSPNTIEYIPINNSENNIFGNQCLNINGTYSNRNFQNMDNFLNEWDPNKFIDFNSRKEDKIKLDDLNNFGFDINRFCEFEDIEMHNCVSMINDANNSNAVPILSSPDTVDFF